jgi:hypothetical protein
VLSILHRSTFQIQSQKKHDNSIARLRNAEKIDNCTAGNLIKFIE